MTKSILRFLPLVMVLTIFAACGGGGGGGFTPTPPPPTGWQPGVFLAASTFQNMCAAPRVGADPTNNNQPYPDMQGTVLDENNFLRSFTNDTYLWYDQIVDRDPALTNGPENYFDLLVNIPNDRFSFSFDTQERFDLVQGGVSAGYGAEWAVISPTAPREIVVAYTEPNTPATNHAPPLLRGTTILSIDGTDINTNTQAGVDALNEGLFPSVLGVPHT
ncbi:MAG: peptidase, partial [Woeseiaceae bacterium]|nr:peptidase [Woeseiaceae bacterium]MDX2607195.1 peptidase [Woeseiaceae bacterium]